MIKISIRHEDEQKARDSKERLYKGSSLIDFPSEYICVDVETSGLDPSDDEIIEVAALHVKEGVALNKFVSLVRPLRSHALFTYGMVREMGYDSLADVPYDAFDEFYRKTLISSPIEDLTGITNDMLLSAPPADIVMPQFYDFVGNHILVGHNVNFDINFLYDACQSCGLTLHNHFVDTMRIARKLLPEMEHHRLSDLAEHFEIVQDETHRAEADVITTIKCFDALKALASEKWASVPDFVNWYKDSARITSARSVRKIRAEKHFRPADLVQPGSVDRSHPLCGKSIVFTGELRLSRREAAQLAADVGAVVKTDVSGKTNFLVVGLQDATLVGSSGISGKERKAKELNETGKGNIRILSEQEFMDLVQQKTEAGVL